MAELNYKGQLIRHCGLSGLSFRFQFSKTGPPHDPSFTSYVYVNDERCGEGQDKTIRAAENLACKIALLSLQNQEQGNHEMAHQAGSSGSPGIPVVLNSRAVVTLSPVNGAVSNIMFNANYVGLFIEFCKKNEWLDFRFVDDQTGPSHMPEFFCSAVVGERKFPGARGKSKKEAKQNAACVALRVLKQEYPEDLQLQQIPGLDDVEQAEERTSESGRFEDNNERSAQGMEIEHLQSENSDSQNMSSSSLSETPLLSRRPHNSEEHSSTSTQGMEIEPLQSENSGSQSMSCSSVSGTPSASSNFKDRSSQSKMEIESLRSDSSDFQIVFRSSVSGTPLAPSRPHTSQDNSISMQEMEIEPLPSEHHDSKIISHSPVSGTSSVSRRPRKRFKLAPYFRNHDPLHIVTTEDKGPVNTGSIKPSSESRLHRDTTRSSELKSHSSDLAPLNVQSCGNQPTSADSGGEFLTSSSGISSNSNREQSPLAAFDNITYLDEGGFAEVVKARKKIDVKYYAVKIVEVEVKDKNALQEVKALAHLEHENIVRYYNAWFGPKYSSGSSERGKSSSDSSRIQNYLYIQMELCENGSLKSWISERNLQNKVNKSQSLRIFCQIIEGVTYIHSKKFIHRDLKPANIFFTKDLTVKIGDFGLVTPMTNKEESEALERTRGAGTESYMAPEQEDNKYENEVDIYSLGLILFELLWIFHFGHERVKHWNNIRNGKFPSGFEDQYPSETYEIRRMLSRDPKKRPLAEELAIYFARVKTVSSQSL